MHIRKTALVAILSLCCLTIQAEEKAIPNRLIDYDRFLESAQEVGKLRKQRRVTEEQFIKMAQEPGTIVFDARSDEKYRLLHIKGATHLSLPDVTATELAKVIPEKTARILIYCNNNFDNSPAAFPAKATDASLNIFTFNTLYSYGYKNIYELGPVIDANNTRLQFEGTRASNPRR